MSEVEEDGSGHPHDEEDLAAELEYLQLASKGFGNEMYSWEAVQIAKHAGLFATHEGVWTVTSPRAHQPTGGDLQNLAMW